MNDQRHPTREEVLEAIGNAQDKATVREAQRLVRYWVDENPEDAEIPLAAESLNGVAVAVVTGQTAPETTLHNTLHKGQWLTVAEAVGLLKRSDKTVRRMIERGDLEGELATTERGREWRIKATSVYAHVAEADGRQGRKLTEANGNLLEGDGRVIDTLTEGLTETNAQQVTEGAGIVTEGQREGQNRQIEAVAGEVHQLRSEIESLKAFIAGGALQAISERLATLPDAEQTAQMMAQAVQDGVTLALQANTAQQADSVTKEDVAAAVEQGIKAAVGDSEEQERQSTAKAISEAQAPVIERLEKVLERQQWLEEDNANLRKELAAQQNQGFFGRLFGKKGQDRGG